MSVRVKGRFVGAMGLTCWVFLVALGSAGVANAALDMIGCDGDDDDDTKYTGLGGDNCDAWADALNRLDGVSGLDCGGNYPYLYADVFSGGCGKAAAAMNKIVGHNMSQFGCDGNWGFLAVPDGACPGTPGTPSGTLHSLAAYLQGPTCKHGTALPGPAGRGGNCTGACDQGWSGTNCDLASVICTAATDSQCAAQESCPASAYKCVEGAANGACRPVWLRNSSCSSCVDLSQCNLPVKCTAATASQCAAESCPASAPARPYKCVEGAANGACNPTLWHLLNSSCSSCIDLSKCPTQPPPTPVAHCQPELAKGGCYTDAAGNAVGTLRVLPHTVSNLEKGMTQELCAGYCAALNYSFAGVEFGLGCYCGDRLPPASYKLPAAQCEAAKCDGNATEDCGGNAHPPRPILVYSFVCGSAPAVPPTTTLRGRTFEVPQQV